jgi:hypothetical protein
MNWNQLYSSATPEERLEILIAMIRTKEARHNKLILAGTRLIRERRDPFKKYHRIGWDRRSPYPQWYRAIRKTVRHTAIVLCVGAFTGGMASLALSGSSFRAIITILSYEIAIVGLLYLRKGFTRRFIMTT